MSIVDKPQTIDALNALAQETRLELFRLIVSAGPNGLTPSVLSRQLKIAPPTLSFHLGRLAHAGLVRSRRRGRSIGYTADGEIVEQLLATLNASLRPAKPIEPPPEVPAAREGAEPTPAKAKDPQPSGAKVPTT